MRVGSSPNSFDFSEEYLYEIKWDGIRCMVVRDHGHVRLFSKSKVDITDRFPEVVEELEITISIDSVIDGELVVLNKSGLPEFLNVMNRFNTRNKYAIQRKSKSMPACCVCFDQLWSDGKDLTSQPLEERRNLLEKSFDDKGGKRVQLNSVFEDGRELFKSVSSIPMEGVVAKRKRSIYKKGSVSNNWLKIKHRESSTCTISKVGGRSDKRFVVIEEGGRDRGIVELGINRSNVDLLKPGVLVEIEHGLLSSNGHFREPYLVGLK